MRGRDDAHVGVQLPLAADPLEALFSAYTLRDDIAKDAARMLLLINIKDYTPRKVVQYFEVVKEKAPELVLTFDQLAFFAGLRTRWSLRAQGQTSPFLTTEPNAEVRAIHPKAMPVILSTPAEVDRWLEAEAAEL